MEESAQSLRLTRLSGKRDMSTLLSQSAFSVSFSAGCEAVRLCATQEGGERHAQAGDLRSLCTAMISPTSGYFAVLALRCA